MPRTSKRECSLVIAANVRVMMKRRDWTQEQLAKRAGVSQTHVGNVLRAQHAPSADVIERIAGAFGVPPYLLLVPDLAPEMLDSPELPLLVERYAAFRRG